MCALYLYIYREIMLLHTIMVFTDILRIVLFVLVTFNCVQMFGRFDPDNYIVTGTQAGSGILTDNKQRFLPCGITLKPMVAIKEQTISHCEWNDESSACAALFCCVGFFWPQFTVCCEWTHY